MIPIRTALVSVSDKSNLENLVFFLNKKRVRIIATGGTAQFIRNLGVEVQEVSDLTSFPEILGGRVKTLHPVIEGGILARRGLPSDMADLAKHRIQPIDLVVCNLYPFEKMIESGERDLSKVVEEIDIGGITLLRASAKNYRYVVIVSSPQQYQELMEEMERNSGAFPEEKSLQWAIEAFQKSSLYDSHIARYLEKLSGKEEYFPKQIAIVMRKKAELRYGENPHQRGAFYEDCTLDAAGFFRELEILYEDKELSFNNLYDVQAAFSTVREFEEPATVIVKHNNPCGVAIAQDLAHAAEMALQCDPVSAFGGIVAFNKNVTVKSAEVFKKIFLEVIIAPSYDDDALELLRHKKGIRILRAPLKPLSPFDLKKIDGGFLFQDGDRMDCAPDNLRVVTEKSPSEEEWKDLLFAFKVAKHVKSNAIVLAKERQTVGIGAGQMSRIDAMYIAVRKSQGREKGAVLASDAFFPFSDVVEEAGKCGIGAIIQPGGSIRDQDSIDACNRLGISMVFTGVRHFKH
ncbi:MAG: bifunctional phosphoribosylaminoimidazolecarboxamide formyltransferase/IMP cyclohydrolase [Atribacterota bacterium]|nr:bifunctional phosphoribosylaminoimidazolecarboxamide formyltransferase/IMP cyclohydrolase [Atribacterota bacterium]